MINDKNDKSIQCWKFWSPLSPSQPSCSCASPPLWTCRSEQEEISRLCFYLGFKHNFHLIQCFGSLPQHELEFAEGAPPNTSISCLQLWLSLSGGNKHSNYCTFCTILQASHGRRGHDIWARWGCQQEELGGDGGEKGDTVGVGVDCGFCLKCVRL